MECLGNVSSHDTAHDYVMLGCVCAGHYMYTEVSAPRRRGDKAALKSFVIASTSQQTCVSFWYHMSGSQIGTLNVYLKVNGQNQQRIWTLSGQSNCLPLPAPLPPSLFHSFVVLQPSLDNWSV